MRNLALVAITTVTLENLNLSTTALDLDDNLIYATSERQNLDGEVDIELWNIGRFDTVGLNEVRSNSALPAHSTHCP
jgi:elongator complex protein 1